MTPNVTCPVCHGSGACLRCGGSGGGDSRRTRCPDCKGTGDCERCAGEGVVPAEPDESG